MKRLMAIDYGKSRIGIALSDSGRSIAFPLKTLDARKSTVFEEIADIVREFDVSHIYIGNPLLLSGGEGSLSKEVRAFMTGLMEHLEEEVGVSLVDERLTTKIAERLVREAGQKPSREKGKVDRISAAIILQGVLDSSLDSEGEESPRVQ